MKAEEFFNLQTDRVLGQGFEVVGDDSGHGVELGEGCCRKRISARWEHQACGSSAGRTVEDSGDVGSSS